MHGVRPEVSLQALKPPPEGGRRQERGGGDGTGPQGSLHAAGARQPSCCAAFPDGPGSPVQGVSVPGKEQRKGRDEAPQMPTQGRIPCRLRGIQMSGSAVYTQRVFICISFMCGLGCNRAVEKFPEAAGPTEPHRLTFCLLERKSPSPRGRSEHSAALFAEQLRAGTASGPSAGIAPVLPQKGRNRVGSASRTRVLPHRGRLGGWQSWAPTLP